MIVDVLWKLPGMKEGSWVMDQALVFLFLGSERKLVGGGSSACMLPSFSEDVAGMCRLRELSDKPDAACQWPGSRKEEACESSAQKETCWLRWRLPAANRTGLIHMNISSSVCRFFVEILFSKHMRSIWVIWHYLALSGELLLANWISESHKNSIMKQRFPW